MSTATSGDPGNSQQEAAGWAAYLAGVPLGLELPEDRPRAAERSFHEDRRPLTPGPMLLGGVAALARNEQTVPAVVWLAALQALLHRYTSETDVLVGSPAQGAEPAVMPWRARLDGDLPFRALVGRVEAVRRMHGRLGPLSVEECAELLHGEATPRGLPLFQVGFVPGEAVALDPAALAGWVVNADLTLLLTGSAMADPDRRLSELQLLSDAERHQILVEWNASSVDLPDRLFHQSVEDQAARTPAATAVVDRAERLTYERLNARANQLAHHLRALGAREDVRVVVGLERSAAHIVAVLAVLKTGATAVLLDPVNPPSRLRFMLRDAEPVALVTREGLLERFAGPQRPAVVCVDRDRELLASRPTGNPPPAAVTQDSASHVIYTSGSTGEPKGTMAPHCATSRAFSASSVPCAGRRRSAGPWATPACTCSTGTASPCHRACWGSCTLRPTACPSATSTGPS